jgi:RNA polymerase sigma-70 factor (ECF subfamily)
MSRYTSVVGPRVDVGEVVVRSAEFRSAITDEAKQSSPNVDMAQVDAVLIARVGRGDRAALAELYDQYSARAYSLACNLVGATAAMDVVHDAFVALVDKPSTFDSARGSFRAWFLTGVHHRCLNLLRAQRPSLTDASLAEVIGPEPDPPEAIVAHLRDAAVRNALLGLGHDQREVLVLAYYGGLTQSALAKRLGVPLGTVKARMRRGLLTLRAALRGDALGDEEEGSA